MHCYKHTSYDVEGATWWREMLLFVFRTLPVYLLINYGLCDNKPSTNEAIVHDFLPCFIYVYFFLCFYCYNQFNTLLMVSVTGLVSGWKLNIPFGGGSGSWVAERLLMQCKKHSYLLRKILCSSFVRCIVSWPPIPDTSAEQRLRILMRCGGLMENDCSVSLSNFRTRLPYRATT